MVGEHFRYLASKHLIAALFYQTISVHGYICDCLLWVLNQGENI